LAWRATARPILSVRNPTAVSAATASADVKVSLIVSGTGDVIEPDEPIASIGSGGHFAIAAGTALLEHTKMSSRQVAEEAMRIAGKICIYTNDSVSFEELE
jgi:ATP-dependent HslUV protease subunit HslV